MVRHYTAQFRPGRADLYRNQDFRPQALQSRARPGTIYWVLARRKHPARFSCKLAGRCERQFRTAKHLIDDHIDFMDDRQMKRKNHLRLPAELTMRRKDSFLSVYMPGFSFSISFEPEAAVSRRPPLRTCTFLFHRIAGRNSVEAPHNHPMRHTVFGHQFANDGRRETTAVSPKSRPSACEQDSRSQFSVCPKV